LRGAGEGRLRTQALRLVAGYAQFAGWAHADAGAELPARRAYRVALRAATTAGDRPLAAHVLGSLSHQSRAAGAPDEALALARAAGWRHAAAGAALPARGACRVALRAATTAGDRPLAAHVLGSLSHQSLAAGAPDEALALARAGYAGARADGTPLLRALLLHR